MEIRGAARRNGRHPLVESFDCPLAELGLIRHLGGRRYAFRRGPRPGLPPAILAAAVHDFWNLRAGGQSRLSIDRLLYGAGAPGGAFQFDERSLVQALENLPEETGLHYDETAGERRLTRHRRREPLSVLRDYYGRVPA